MGRVLDPLSLSDPFIHNSTECLCPGCRRTLCGYGVGCMEFDFSEHGVVVSEYKHCDSPIVQSTDDRLRRQFKQW